MISRIVLIMVFFFGILMILMYKRPYPKSLRVKDIEEVKQISSILSGESSKNINERDR